MGTGISPYPPQGTNPWDTALLAYLNNVLVPLSKVPDALITGNIVRNSNEVVTSATVTWPDGTPGVFTTDSIGPLNTVDAYHITYLGTVAVTFTQALITRDSAGAAIAVPNISVA